MKPKKRNLRKIVAISIIAITLLFVLGFYIYSLDYYHADDLALQTIATEENNMQSQGDMVVLYPNKEKDSSTALIFYPGGKVEAIAYLPLLAKLSQRGITCVLIEMPLNLAVFNINAADNVYNQLPNIKNWYIGGHSLGGAMASNYANKKSDKIKGLILLGAYPDGDTDMSTLAIYGSKDMVVNKQKLENTKNKLEIAGGNHAYFANYGEQKGDGIATITREEQQKQTTELIVKFMREKNQ